MRLTDCGKQSVLVLRHQVNHVGIAFIMWQVIFDFNNKEFPFIVLTEAPAWSIACFLSKWRNKSAMYATRER